MRMDGINVGLISYIVVLFLYYNTHLVSVIDYMMIVNEEVDSFS